MKSIIFIIALNLILFTAFDCEARKRKATYVDGDGVRREQKTGKIYRDYGAVKKFKQKNPKPNDGHAYDVDHIKPLSKGGADKPSNMQWIRAEDHRKKTAKENREKQ